MLFKITFHVIILSVTLLFYLCIYVVIYFCSVDLEKLEINKSRVSTDTETQISKITTQMFVCMGGYRQDSSNTRQNEGQGKISSELLILLPILNFKKDNETGSSTLGLRSVG